MNGTVGSLIQRLLAPSAAAPLLLVVAAGVPSAALADAQTFQYEFNACVVTQDFVLDATNTNGQLVGWQRLVLVNHGPGSAEPEFQIGFVTRPQSTGTAVQSRGAYGTGVKFYYLEVPASYFQWVRDLAAQYKPLHVTYSYKVDDQGNDTLQHVDVGPVPPSEPAKCP